jgi:hypothetical protein
MPTRSAGAEALQSRLADTVGVLALVVGGHCAVHGVATSRDVADPVIRLTLATNGDGAIRHGAPDREALELFFCRGVESDESRSSIW